ncbi:MAG: proteasome subunit alpha [Candidatus Microthrix sp.]|nr:proteasome subunit alpha [Candidatus Microthrix sp.]MBK6502655.1 proteasome subunit alpha [Candidatus Microthrix sp.]
MTQPFYVAPEQVMKDRADYARKGISRGRSLIGLSCSEAILICAENPSRLLRKISEIYDRIAFAGVGKYNEFDQLRIAGVRSADLKGYAYSREDVDGRSLANGYAQMLGNVFTHEMKPMEVEILVAEVSGVPSDDRLFHILYDGTLIDQSGFTVLGGDADAVRDRVSAEFEGTPDLATGLRLAAAALGGPERALSASDLEVAVLDRQVEHRSFRRLAEGGGRRDFGRSCGWSNRPNRSRVGSGGCGPSVGGHRHHRHGRHRPGHRRAPSSHRGVVAIGIERVEGGVR